MKPIHDLILACCLLSSVAGCGEPKASARDEGGDAPPAVPAKDAAPAAPEGEQQTASGLRWSVVKAGPAEGRHPRRGDRVKVHYTGTLTDGKVFDSSRERGAPAEFEVGSLIPGWNEALTMMRPGDRWNLRIPPDIGYGARGAGASIPPGATLLFDVELIEILPGPPEFVLPDPADLVKTESGLCYQILRPGEGEAPGEGVAVELAFALWNKGGDMLQCTETSGALLTGVPPDLPFPFLNEISKILKPGARARLIVPASLSYGDKGLGPALPGGSESIWEVELKRVARPLPVPAFVMPPEESLVTTASGLRIQTLKEGKGNSPRMGQKVHVHYAGWLTDGTKFDDSYSRGFDTAFELGRVIQGWNEGLATMKPGGVAILVIPSKLGYGPRGAGDKIPGGATLVFRVELLSVEE